MNNDMPEDQQAQLTDRSSSVVCSNLVALSRCSPPSPEYGSPSSRKCCMKMSCFTSY